MKEIGKNMQMRLRDIFKVFISWRFLIGTLCFGQMSCTFCVNHSDAPISKKIIAAEMSALKKTKDPVSTTAIKYVLVLSGRNSYLNVYHDPRDPKDDYERMQLGIAVARRVAAMRAKISDLDQLTMQQLQQYGPKIIYNGRAEQNADLKQALDTAILTEYPKENFIILELSPAEVNTKGQFACIKHQLKIEDCAVAVVSHAYHFPRLSRMLDIKAPLYPFGNNVEVFAFLVDRNFQSPSSHCDARAEIEKIPSYIKKGDLSPQSAPNLYYKR